MADTRNPPAFRDVQAAFRAFCGQVGLDPGHDPQPTDGKPRRFDVIGADGRVKKKRGWYVFYADGERPAGVVADHAQGGLKHTWTWEGPRQTFDRAAWRAERVRMRALQAEREAKQREAWAAAAKAAAGRMKLTKAAAADHPYLVRKQIPAFCARQLGDKLHIPVHGPDGAIMSLQTIDPAGNKLFWTGGCMQGAWTALTPDWRGAPRVVVTEGFATGASIAKACAGVAVVIAFSAHNIPAVADMVARQAAGVVIIAADNDSETEAKIGDNPGVRNATKAARQTGALLAIPPNGDFNDLALAQGDAAVLAAIDAARPAAAPPAKPFEPAPIQQEPEPAIPLDAFLPSDPDWRTDLAYKDDGEKLADKDFKNFRLMLEHHEDMAGVIRLDAFRQVITMHGALWHKASHDATDADIAHCREWLQRKGLKPTKDETQDAMAIVAARRAFDPLTDYLTALKWDGVERINAWLTDYCGAPDSLWSSVVGPKFLISAVARAMEPGCKVDTMLVLEGDQGVNKSSSLETLFGAAFTTSATAIFNDPKESVSIMAGAWCVEVAELAAIFGARNQARVTALITTRVDKVRLPYARTATQHPRRCVFVGTVNPDGNGYLEDTTGNRRYWPVAVTEIDRAQLARDRDQLWAEAVHRYRAGEPWWLTDDQERSAAKAETAEREAREPWDDLLAQATELQGREFITANDALAFLQVSIDKRDRRSQMRVAGCLQRAGWRRTTLRANGRTVKAWTPPGRRNG